MTGIGSSIGILNSSNYKKKFATIAIWKGILKSLMEEVLEKAEEAKT